MDVHGSLEIRCEIRWLDVESLETKTCTPMYSKRHDCDAGVADLPQTWKPGERSFRLGAVTYQIILCLYFNRMGLFFNAYCTNGMDVVVMEVVSWTQPWGREQGGHL